MAKNSQLLIDLGQGLAIRVGLPRLTSWDTPGRPKKPRPGTLGFNTQTNNLEYWDGSNWLAASFS